MFRNNGYQVELTKQSNDMGADIVVSNNTETVIIQCKATKKPVGVGVVRDLYGTIAHFGASDGIVASISGFTKQAQEFANGKNIQLWSLDEILILESKQTP